MSLLTNIVPRLFGKGKAPVHIIWFVTSRCNLRCQHCFVPSKPSAGLELSTGEIVETIKKMPPLLSLSLTGGEPFLRDDLPELCKAINDNRVTDNLLLYSNGLDVKRTVSMVEKILQGCPHTKVSLGVSIDGFEADHDVYRGRDGAYKSAMETLRHLADVRRSYPAFRYGPNITLHSGNQDSILLVREQLKAELGLLPGFTVIRGDVHCPRLKGVDPEIYEQLINEHERDLRATATSSLFEAVLKARIFVGHRLALQVFSRGERSYACYAGALMGVIYEGGEVYPCEMLVNHCMGNLRDHGYDLQALWGTSSAQEIRDWIDEKECHCTYECQYTCNVLFNYKQWPRLLFNVMKALC